MEKLLRGFIRIEQSIQIATLVGVAIWVLHLSVSPLQNSPRPSTPMVTPTTSK
jgi:hypothetical protein